ncbi:MAG: CNNM domain-containing protein, partial [Bacteroidota bacterium]|nr:CNNM domain-containing protein [Bacteroidota bacterium]
MTVDILITLFLVFLNGFFVAAEFAIVKVRSSQIALEKGTLAKDAAKSIIENLDGYLAATQLGITLASL